MKLISRTKLLTQKVIKKYFTAIGEIDLLSNGVMRCRQEQYDKSDHN